MYGTGWSGSLTNSSNASPDDPAGASKAEPAVGEEVERLGFASRGGQRSCRCHSFRPVSKAHASGGSHSPRPFRWCSKNGNSIFSR